MTQLAQFLGNIIRERGGWLPTNDNNSWLEEKAKEIENLVRSEAPTYKVGDTVELTLDFGKKHIVKVTEVEKGFDGIVYYYTDMGTWFSESTVSRLIEE